VNVERRLGTLSATGAQAAVLPLLLRFGVPFLLCWLLLGSGLLAWRRWRDRPWLAAVAAALVVALAAILFHTKWLALAAVIAGIAALSLARPRGGRVKR